MKIEVKHSTIYHYGDSVTNSVNEIRLTPRTNRYQSCHHHRLLTYPNTVLFSYEDFFGNRVHSFTIHHPHKELRIESSFVISKRDRNTSIWDPFESQEREMQLICEKDFRNRYAEYLLPTKRTGISVALQLFMSEFIGISDAENIFEFAKRVCSIIKNRFTYDKDATHVNTTIDEMLAMRRGVCQDYAHLMITIMRSYGIPARYVSGYHFIGEIDKPRLDYEHASHAWVEVYIPDRGWLGIDPTNDSIANWRYIKLAHGRDYSDIVPVKGVYNGPATEKMEVMVEVRLLDATGS